MQKQQHSPVVATVWRHWKPTFKNNGWGVFLTFLFYSLSAYFDLMMKPVQWKQAFDALQSGGNPWPAFRMVVYLGISAWVMSRIGEFIIVRCESNILKQLRDYTLRGLLGKNSQFFTTYSPGGLVAKAKRFANSSEAVIDELVFSIIRSVLLVLYLLIYTAFVLPEIAIIFALWVTVFLTIALTISHLRMKHDLVSSKADSTTTARLSDILLSIGMFRMFAGTPQEYEAFMEITDSERMKRKKAWYIGNIQWATQHFLMIGLEICCMGYILNQVYQGQATIGTAVMVQAYIVSLNMNMWNFGRSWIRIRVAFADAYEMSSLLDHPDVEPIDVGNISYELAHNGIHLQNAQFSYLKGRPVIRDLTFHFKPGMRYGVIGKTGSGKSTLIKLLLRLYDHESGSVIVGDHDIDDINKLILRSWISCVPQQPQFPSRTVREIMYLAKRDANEDEIGHALRKASCDFVWNLEKGFDTEIGERGVKLSGGECQRLAIAMAILKNAPILVMDEPTSALDSETEHAIQEVLKNEFHEKTIIVIAHRLATVAILDEIIHMHEGKIIENGSHVELLDRSEQYAHMWDLQTKPQIYA